MAEPIILLKFRMPTDFNDATGVYDLQSDQSAEFSGLYRVIQVENNFSDGRYSSVLHLTRFNNQGVYISDPVPRATKTNRNGVTEVTLREKGRIKSYQESLSRNSATKANENLTTSARKFVNLVSKIKGFTI